MTPFGVGDIDYTTFFGAVGAKGYHNPMWEQDTRSRRLREPGAVARVRAGQLRQHGGPARLTRRLAGPRPVSASPGGGVVCRCSGRRHPGTGSPDTHEGRKHAVYSPSRPATGAFHRCRPRSRSRRGGRRTRRARRGPRRRRPRGRTGSEAALDWSNYEKITLTKDTGEPIDMAVLPDGKVLHTARNGDVRLTDPDAGTTKIVTTVPVYNNSEDGLQTITPGPRLRDEPVGLPLLRAAHHDGALPDDDADRLGAEHPARRGRRVLLGPVEGLQPADPRQVGRRGRCARPHDRAGHPQGRGQQRGQCCHVGGDVDFDDEGNVYLVDRRQHAGQHAGGQRLRPEQRRARLQPRLRLASRRRQHQRPARQDPAGPPRGRRELHDPRGQPLRARHRTDPSRDLRDGRAQPLPHGGRPRDELGLVGRVRTGCRCAQRRAWPDGLRRVDDDRRSTTRSTRAGRTARATSSTTTSGTSRRRPRASSSTVPPAPRTTRAGTPVWPPSRRPRPRRSTTATTTPTSRGPS